MEYIIFIIILIFLIVIVYAITRPVQNNELVTFFSLTSMAVPITIIDATNIDVCSSEYSVNGIQSSRNNSIRKYCDSWNYIYSESINTNNNGITLYLRDPSINIDINFNRSLDVISNIASNIKFIVFDDHSNEDLFYQGERKIKSSLNYLTNNSNITWDEIQQEIDDTELPPQLIRNILSEGYPYILKNGMFLHKGYLDYIFHNKNLPFDIPVIISSNIEPRIKETSSNKSTKIPKIIHQTFETRCLPTKMAMAVYSWINRNLDYEYRYYDEYDRREFIKSHFNSDVLQAYDSLIPGAYKADLWRYCAVYIDGGIYIDIKMGALVPLSRIIPPDADLMIVNDTHDMTLYNAFFAATPKHPALLKTIELVTKRVLNKEYGDHMLYPTGPMAMGAAILPSYQFGPHAPNGKYIINDEVVQVYSHTNNGDSTNIIDVDRTNLVNIRYDRSISESYINLITGRPHYRFLWNSHAIYRR